MERSLLGTFALVSLLSSPWLLDGSPSSGSFILPTTRESAVGMLVTSPKHLTLAGLLTVTARMDILSGAPTFEFDTEPFNTCPAPATARPYFALANIGTRHVKKGENPDYWRWWSNPSAIVLAEGATTISVPLQPSAWSSVNGERGDASAAATAGFWRTLQDAGSVGLTFGSGCFFGHGVYVRDGAAQFTLLSFTVN